MQARCGQRRCNRRVSMLVRQKDDPGQIVLYAPSFVMASLNYSGSRRVYSGPIICPTSLDLGLVSAVPDPTPAMALKSESVIGLMSLASGHITAFSLIRRITPQHPSTPE